MHMYVLLFVELLSIKKKKKTYISQVLQFVKVLETSPQLKFKADGQFVHYALFHPSTDGRLKTQSLVVPYILAFKGETPAHGSYCVNGEVKPSCELVTKNQYPTYCNVISGLESAERILQIYSSSSKKVIYFFLFFPPWFCTCQLYFSSSFSDNAIP